jgi:hypothetical protein
MKDYVAKDMMKKGAQEAKNPSSADHPSEVDGVSTAEKNILSNESNQGFMKLSWGLKQVLCLTSI